MNDIQNILSHILIPNSGSKFYIFSNIDGKTWIMPHRNMSTAMNLYQPGGIKGKWMKCFFPFLKDVGLVRKKIGISVCNYELSSSLKTRLNSIFKTDNIEFSVFCGTPSAHQKITIQISHGNKILGYCKFSNKEEICSLFLHEQTILDALKEKQFKFIPECLYFGMLPDNIYLFVQSTLKTKWSKVLHQWTDLHWQFLYELKQKTEQKILFEQTDFFTSIQLLQQNVSYISENKIDAVSKAIGEILNYYENKIVVFSVCHGDYTPWNMFLENGQLFVFDWEYARLTYPAYFDCFHFFMQCCIFEQHLEPEEIYQLYTKQKNELFGFIENADFYYICYLLDIISRYVNRDKGIYDEGMTNSMAIWTKLIEKLNVCDA